MDGLKLAGPGGGNLGGPAVLVFALEAMAARLLAAALGRGGYRIITVNDEDHAMTALAEDAIDLIVVHLGAPDPECLDFVKLQRMGDPADPLLPVVVLADVMTADLERACDDARVDLRLSAPVEPRYLLDYVGDLLARR